MTIITLLYPAVEFDLDYYLKNHMPLVASRWAKFGLKSWQVLKVDPTSGHGIQCIMDWDSPASFMEAIQEDGEEIMGDVKNYTAGTPVSIVGEVVASG